MATEEECQLYECDLGGIIHDNELSVIIWLNGDPRRMHAGCAIRYANSHAAQARWEQLEVVYQKCRAAWMSN